MYSKLPLGLMRKYNSAIILRECIEYLKTWYFFSFIPWAFLQSSPAAPAFTEANRFDQIFSIASRISTRQGSHLDEYIVKNKKKIFLSLFFNRYSKRYPPKYGLRPTEIRDVSKKIWSNLSALFISSLRKTSFMHVIL